MSDYQRRVSFEVDNLSQEEHASLVEWLHLNGKGLFRTISTGATGMGNNYSLHVLIDSTISHSLETYLDEELRATEIDYLIWRCSYCLSSITLGPGTTNELSAEAKKRGWVRNLYGVCCPEGHGFKPTRKEKQDGHP